jgi:ABC-type uncharacterized transport system permease subunit
MIETGTLVSVALYLLTFALLVIGYSKGRENFLKLSLASWSIALIFHATLLYFSIFSDGGLNLSFYHAISAVSILVSLVLLLSSLNRPVQSLGLIVLPVIILSLLLELFFPGLKAHITSGHNGLKLHILFSLLAYALLTLAAAQAVLLSYQDYKLRHHHPVGLISKLPPLQHMEELLFHWIALGFILLTLALSTGFIYFEEFFGKNIAHKTVLSLLSWIVFAVLLWGRWRLGWRGRKAIRWTLWGFALLALAYFGTRLIREFILNRA